MGFNPLRRKWQKFVAAFLLLLSSILVIGALIMNNYLWPMLSSKIKDIVSKSSDGLYKVSFGEAEFHMVRGTIVIYNITLTPDTAKYYQLKVQHMAPNNLVQLHVKRLVISQIHPLKLYFEHKLDIGLIEFYEPSLNASYELNQLKDSVTRDRRTTWQKIEKKLKSISIGRILLGDVKFKYQDYTGNKVAVRELKEMNLSAYNLLIDSTTQADSTRFLYCKNIVAEINNYQGKTPNKLYNYNINFIRLSTQQSQLSINGITLNPVNMNTFFDKSKADRFELRVDSVQVNHFNYVDYYKYRIINTTKLIVNGGSIHVYANPNKLNEGLDKTKTFPAIGLQNLHSDILIDTLQVFNFNILYSEYNKKSDKTGSVNFNKTEVTLTNITTNKVALAKNNFCEAKLSSYFMGIGKMNANLSFNLTSQLNDFSYNGQLETMELKAINTATMPLGLVKINSGTLKQFSFDVKANQIGSSGQVGLLYNNLEVVLLKADTTLNKFKRKPIATVFANHYFVKHNNPEVENGRPRVAHVVYTRTKDVPFFKSLWRTLFMGIKPCVGFDEKKEEEVKAINKEQIELKEERKIRKEKRIQRREEKRKKKEEQNAHKASTPTDGDAVNNE
jgi:hypothetical protein